MQSPNNTRGRKPNSFTTFCSPARSSMRNVPSPPSSPTRITPRRRRRTTLIDMDIPRHVFPTRVRSSSTSQPTDWKSETYGTLVYFFNKPIPEIPIDDRGKPSIRPPAAFDLHLDKSLILKTVKLSSLIVPDLLEIAMNSLHQLESDTSLPLGSSGLSYTSLLAEIIPLSSVSAQSDLANHYATNIAADCSLVAAALLLRLPTWTSARLLEYSRDTSGQTHSRADGFLRLQLGALESTRLSKEVQGALRGTNRTFPRLATWLFKRLGEGKEEQIMRQILRFSNAVEFPWTSCEGDECNHLSMDGSVHVTGAHRGPDAANPTVRLDETYWSDDDEDISAGDIRNACYILQQAWAQSVANDTTFLVIKSPNYEIIGYRDRENQSLLLSDLIHVPSFHEGYMQLQIGLYMSIVEDALNRYCRGKAAPIPRIRYDAPAVRTVKVRKPKNERERVASWNAAKNALSAFEKLAFHVRVSPGLKRDFPQYLLQSTYFRASEPGNNGKGTLHLALETMPDTNICVGRVTAGRTLFEHSVVCKIARTREEAERLNLEYQAYQTLGARSVPCLAAYGLFHSKGGSAVMLLEHVKQTPNLEFYRDKYVKLLETIHALGLVHGRITENSLLCTDYGYACFGSLSHLRKAKSAQEQGQEMKALEALFEPRTRRPRISHALSIGPLTQRRSGKNLVEMFHFVVSLMHTTFPRPIRVSEGQVPDMVDVEFEDVESRDGFFDKWCSTRKPTGFRDVGCTVHL